MLKWKETEIIRRGGNQEAVIGEEGIKRGMQRDKGEAERALNRIWKAGVKIARGVKNGIYDGTLKDMKLEKNKTRGEKGRESLAS